MNPVIVTTSWDDGHALDIRLAELLRKYQLAGTFYISPGDHEFKNEELLTREQTAELAKDFEIGAHTINHPRLSTVGLTEAKKEIVDSKKYLEEIVKKPIVSFCYPGGDFNHAHKEIVKNAGFKLARTVKRFSFAKAKDVFEVNTSLHAYRHWSDLLPIFWFSGPVNFLRNYLNWDKLAIAMFDRVAKDGGIFHIWGHSWEIDKNGDWERLENVFRHISGKQDVKYLTNGELV